MGTEFVNRRRQKVQSINGKTSNWADMLNGVPQGFVLGPILFLIYMNDIDDGTAEDTKLRNGDKTATGVDSLESDLRQL